MRTWPTGRLQAFVVIARNANVATGAQGRLRRRPRWWRRWPPALGAAPDDVLIASTGVIGRPYPMDRVRAHLERPGAAVPCRSTEAEPVARAMMTTDTVPKVAVRHRADEARIVGVAKGVGMIEPDMATLIALFCTDAEVAPRRARRRLPPGDRPHAQRGQHRHRHLDQRHRRHHGQRRWPGRSTSTRFEARAGSRWRSSLTRQIARDGEGATTLIEVRVDGARDDAQAKRVGKAIVNSPLVKTAVHGADPNWGRVAMAIGKCADDTDIDPDHVVIRFGDGEVYPHLLDDAALAGLSALPGRRRGGDRGGPGRRRRRLHRVRLRPDRRLRPDQRRLHDLTGRLGDA